MANRAARPMSPIGRLESDRLCLRPLSVADITPAYVSALRDPTVLRLTEARHVTWTKQRVVDYIRRSNQPGVSQLIGIFLADSGRHIGNIRLFNFSEAHRRVELALMIFDKAEWSKGYATEAVRRIADHLFGVLKYHRICADYYAVNAASARLFAKAGFQIEGVFNDHFLLEGTYIDSVRVAKLNPAALAGGHATAASSSDRNGSPQGLIPSAGPSITEHEVRLVTEAAREGWYVNMRKYIDEFERHFAAYSGMRYCLAMSSCTGAIHVALAALNVRPGDEVIVPDITWVASAAPICYLGARPVFADIDRHSWCLSPEAFERAITKRTKAAIVVGLLGNLPDMEAILAIADRRGVPIIEDAAESIGAEYKGRKAGTFGTIGVFSFNGTKLMVTGEGGMFVTNDRTLYERAKRLAHHGIHKTPGARYYWSHELGYKYQFTNIQAALGIAQLQRLEELVETRRTHFRWYRQRLQDVEGLQLNEEGAHVRSTFWIVTAMISRSYGLRKERVVRALEQRGIGGRPFFYPLSAMPPFARYRPAKFMRRINRVAYGMSPYGVCLPSSASLTESEAEYICGQLREILHEGKKASRPDGQSLRRLRPVEVTV